jgi:hypothetical protein
MRDPSILSRRIGSGGIHNPREIIDEGTIHIVPNIMDRELRERANGCMYNFLSTIHGRGETIYNGSTIVERNGGLTSAI